MSIDVEGNLANPLHPTDANCIKNHLFLLSYTLNLNTQTGKTDINVLVIIKQALLIASDPALFGSFLQH